MADFAIGVMVGGAAGFAIGKMSEKSSGKKQKEKLKAMLKKKDGGEKKKKIKPSKLSRPHESHAQTHYRPYPSRPLHLPYQMSHEKQHVHHHPLPPNHLPPAIHRQHIHDHLVPARSVAPPMHFDSQAAARYGPSRYY